MNQFGTSSSGEVDVCVLGTQECCAWDCTGGHLAVAAPGQEGTGLCLCAVCPAASSGHMSPATSLRLGRDPKPLDEAPASSEEGPGSGLLEVVTTPTIPEED